MVRPRIRDVNETEKERYKRRWADPAKRAVILQRNKEAKYKARYGISFQTAVQLKQNGCSVCGTKDGKLCVDHCHTTGRVRGCLCLNCNSALGKLGDDYDRILRLAEYLKMDSH